MNNSAEVKPKKKKTWLSLVFVGINILVIVLMALSEFGNQENPGKPFGEIVRLLGENWYFILLALGAFLLIILCESLKYFVMIRACTGRNMPSASFEVATLGKYYDFITPSGTGGQPFQMYYLKKAGLSAGVSGALPVMGFFTNQVSFIVAAIVLFIWRSSALETAAPMKAAAIFGLVCYSVVPVLLVLFSIFPRLTKSIVSGVLKLLSKIRIIKDYEKSFGTVCRYFEDYRSNLYFLAKEKFSFISAFVLSLLAQLAIASVPFFVLRAFGAENTVWLDVMTLSFYVYAAVTFIPTPGNMGVAEGAFYIIFKELSGGVLFWGTMIWRFFTFYLFIILGLLVVAVTSLKIKKNAAKTDAEPAGDCSEAAGKAAGT